MTKRMKQTRQGAPAARLCCPFCGPRAAAEFDQMSAPLVAPAIDASAADWFAALYLQQDATTHRAAETLWIHARGCGSVLAVAPTREARYAAPYLAETPDQATPAAANAPKRRAGSRTRLRRAAVARRRLAG